MIFFYFVPKRIFFERLKLEKMANEFLISTINVSIVYVLERMFFIRDYMKKQRYTIWGERKAKAKWELPLECGIL